MQPWSARRRTSLPALGAQLALRGCSDASYRSVKAPSPSESEGSDETSEEDESAREAKFTLKLRLQPSVYDEALLAPIVRVQQGGERSKGTSIHLCSAYTVLAVNFMLQLVVTSKVGDLTVQRGRKMEAKLWGLCKERDPNVMPFSRELDEEWGWSPQSFYYSCGPMTVTMMSRMRNVDRDGDGFWTFAEAVGLDKLWEAMYAKQATLDVAWKYFARAYREDSSGPQLLDEAAGIPLAWMEGWQNETDLCIITDQLLCGNLEARDILRRKLEGESDPYSRIARCEELVSQRCPRIFGQVYGLYHRWSRELCGGVSTSWLEPTDIMTVDYTLVLKYVKEHDSVVTEYYFSLLVVILLIWVMCMLGQLRVIVDWWLVLIAFPSTPKKEGVWVEESSSSLRVWAIPRLHKLATLFLNLLPRTLIVIFLSHTGTLFLIRADDYDELIMNGVALGFLIETDNMLFVAVSREEEKDMVNACQPLTAEVGIPFFRVKRRSALRDLPVGVAYTMLILVVTFGLIYHEYTKDRGKLDVGQALRCLCHASGRNCVGAQILGGFPSVTDAIGFETTESLVRR